MGWIFWNSDFHLKKRSFHFSQRLNNLLHLFVSYCKERATSTIPCSCWYWRSSCLISSSRFPEYSLHQAASRKIRDIAGPKFSSWKYPGSSMVSSPTSLWPAIVTPTTICMHPMLGLMTHRSGKSGVLGRWNHWYETMDRHSIRPNKAHSSRGLSGLLHHQSRTTSLGSL